MTKASKVILVWRDLLDVKEEQGHLVVQGDLVQKEKLVPLDFLVQLEETVY